MVALKSFSAVILLAAKASETPESRFKAFDFEVELEEQFCEIQEVIFSFEILIVSENPAMQKLCCYEGQLLLREGFEIDTSQVY